MESEILLQVLGPAGAAWVGVKMALNGLKSQVAETHKTVLQIQARVSQHTAQIAVLEDRDDRPHSVKRDYLEEAAGS